MAGTFCDLLSVIEELRGYWPRILEPQGALTLVQQQVFRQRLIAEMKQAGISFDVSSDSDGTDTLFRWSKAIGVEGVGTITDVMPVGAHPIQLALGGDVVVSFEPRRLGSDDYRRTSIQNTEFAGLTKGSPYKFQGMLWWARYYHQQSIAGRAIQDGHAPTGHFQCNVERGGAMSGFFRGLLR